MTGRLRFLSPDECGPEVELEGDGLGKLEVRGEVASLEPEAGEELLPLGPGRALLVREGGTRQARDRLGAAGYRVYDVTSGLAAVEVAGEDAMRRLTELDLDALPATGSVARGVRALVQRREGGRFRLFVPAELACYVAGVVADTAEGLR